MSSDWLRPDWLRDAMRTWTPTAIVPAPFTQAVRQVVDLFGFAPANVAKDVIDAATARLLGREMTLRIGETEVELVLRMLRMVRPPIGLMIAQLGDVEIEADDVRVSGQRINHVRVEARNLHIQPGLTSTVVAAPVHVTATVDQRALSDALATRTDRVDVELLGGGAARATLPGRREWGHVDVVPRIDGHTLLLEPREVVVRGWNRLSPLVRRLPRLRFRLPDVATGAHLVAVEVEEGRLLLRGLVEEWRAELSPVQLDQLVRRIQRFEGGLLDIPRAVSLR